MKENTYCVIMAGGVGSRFWPFSRNNKPKQFLDFFGTGRSLIQMTVDRFRPLVPIENILIVTNVQYKDIVLEQIPDMKPSQVLCEPARRNTAPCIAYAVSHIRGLQIRKAMAAGTMEKWEIQDLSHEAFEANIIVAPSDHLILNEEGFRAVMQDGLDFVTTHDAILTLGMKPTRPETGYGYIQMDKDPKAPLSEDAICKVKTFTEKPNLDLAKVFLESGEFLWNSGIFVWNLRTICSALRAFLPELVEIFQSGEQYMGTAKEDDFIQEKFPTCPNISIDYGVLEKATNVYVKPADFGWSDLGTWGSLLLNSTRDIYGNATVGQSVHLHETSGCIVHAPEAKKVVVQGLEGYIVAERGGNLLVCKLTEEQRIREFCEE